MYVQLLVIFLSLIAAWYYSQGLTLWNQDHRRKQYVIFVCILLILQSGLRHLSVGADTFAYKVMFDDVKSTNWEQIWQNFYDVYVSGEGKDAGYPLFEKLFQIFFPEYRIFLFAIAIFFFGSLGQFLYRNTHKIRDILISVCLYQVLFYGFFSVTGIRQTIATISTLLGYKYIQERRFFPFIILIVIAAFIHKSVLIFLPFYFLARFKYSHWLLIGSTLAVPFIFPLARRFATILATLSANDTYMGYAESDYETSGAQVFFIFMFLIALVTIFKSKSIIHNKNINTVPIINGFSIALIFTPLTWVDPSLMRVVQYYSIFSLLLLPILIDIYSSSRKNKSAIAAICILLFCLVLIRRHTDYAFFWENIASRSIIHYN